MHQIPFLVFKKTPKVNPTSSHYQYVALLKIMAKINVRVFLVLKYCIDTSLWQRTKRLLWYNCCQIENIQGIIYLYIFLYVWMFCTETQTFIESFTHTTTNTFNVYILSQPYAWMYTYKTLNLHASWSYLSYLEGTSNAAAFQLNSFSRVFEPSNTQHRKSTSLSSCAWFKTQELKSY